MAEVGGVAKVHECKTLFTQIGSHSSRHAVHAVAVRDLYLDFGMGPSCIPAISRSANSRAFA